MVESNQRIKIVLIDDNEENCRLIRRFLEFEDDFQIVGVAHCGQDGIHLSGVMRPDDIPRSRVVRLAASASLLDA